MHELSLLLNVVEMVTQDAKSRGITQVSSITVQVGELSGASTYALSAAFPIAVKGTLLDGATLQIDEVVGKAQCKSCGATFEPLRSQWCCPSCGSTGAIISAGRELQVVSYSGEAQECQ